MPEIGLPIRLYLNFSFHLYLFELVVESWEHFQEVVLVVAGSLVQALKGEFEEFATLLDFAQVRCGDPRALGANTYDVHTEEVGGVKNAKMF